MRSKKNKKCRLKQKIIKKISGNFFTQLVEIFEINQGENADSGEGCQVFKFDADFSEA